MYDGSCKPVRQLPDHGGHQCRLQSRRGAEMMNEVDVRDTDVISDSLESDSGRAARQ